MNVKMNLKKLNEFLQNGGPEVDRVLYIILGVLLILFLFTTKGQYTRHQENIRHAKLEQEAKKALKAQKKKEEAEAVSGAAIEEGAQPAPNAPAPTIDPVTGINPMNPTGDPATGGRGPEDTFEDAAFLGDSRTEGLMLYGTLNKATFYTYKGLMASSAMTKKCIKLENGKKGTIIKALKQHTFARVYLCFGLNELGWPDTDNWMKSYIKLVEKVKKIQPTAAIYVQNIMPVTKARDAKDKVFTIKNVTKFNKMIEEICRNQGVTYVDLYSMIANKNGYLPAKASQDGIHLLMSYCKKWSEYLKGKGAQ